MWIPAWLISLLALAIAALDMRRYFLHHNLIIFGKVLSYVIVAMIYIYISFWTPSIMIARELSRLGWLIVLSTEITYRLTKIKWNL